MNFPHVNWRNLISTDNQEQKKKDLIETNLLMQATDFPTCLKNILDVAPYKMCHIHAEKLRMLRKHTTVLIILQI